MQIIVVGCGKVGRNIVTQLIKENNNVTVIDTNADLIHHISTNYDVMGIIGNGSSFNVLRQADLKHADMLIAVTESDEVNLLTCVIAKLNNSGCHTIARVRSPHYSEESHFLQKGLNLSMTIMAMPSDVEEFFRKIGVKTNKAENVMIVGGGATSYYLAKLLSSRNIHVTIIEKDMKRCEELVDALPDVTVDCGDGTDRQLLDEEHLENMDGFVACTGIDEVNAILSLYVMNRVKKKVVTKLNHVDFGELLDNLHLDSVINPKEITAQKIVQYVRAAGNSMESNVETLYRLMNGRVEAMEFFIDKDSLVTGQKLVDMKIKDGVIIAGILRGGRLIIPGGQDEFRIGDTVIVVTTHIGFHDIYNILK